MVGRRATAESTARIGRIWQAIHWLLNLRPTARVPVVIRLRIILLLPHTERRFFSRLRSWLWLPGQAGCRRFSLSPRRFCRQDKRRLPLTQDWMTELTYIPFSPPKEVKSAAKSPV